ncbi:UNVERIFIED_CONTAM: hypothetical protein FKN15_029342 [Acipenser sinensis]
MTGDEATTKTPGITAGGTKTPTLGTQSPVQLNGVTLQYDVGDSTAQPQFESRPSSPSPNPVLPPPREQWGGKYEFLLSCIGYCVGLGNVWRFPYLCYRNGGGVFLIPYFIMMLVTGLPLFLMELSLGQYGAAGPITVWKCCPLLKGVFLIPYFIMMLVTGLPLFLMELSLGQYGAAGPITVWKCCPLLKGIGIGMLLVSSLVCLYYNVIIAWTFYYLGMSFQSPLPWSCDAIANARLCQMNVTNGSHHLSASEVFWNEQVLGVVHSEGLQDPGPVRWQLAICLMVAWIIIFLCMLKGIRSSGKIVYVTATFPYLVLIVLIIRGATLEGSLQGVQFYLTPDWQRLQNAQVSHLLGPTLNFL